MKKQFFLIISIFVLMMSDVSGATNINNGKSRKKMRILFIVDKFPWYTKVVILNQIVGLIQRGHDISIYAHMGVASDKFDPEVFEYKLLEKTYYGKLPSNLADYDIIVCQYGDLGKQFVKMKKALGLKAKFVTFFRGAEVTSPRHIASHEYDDLFAQGDLFVPICDYFKYRLLLLGCNPKKTMVHYSPIDCDKFKYRKRELKKDEKIHIVTTARLHEEKGLIDCIHAVAQLSKKYPNLKYSIVGEGSSRAFLESEIEKLKMEKKIFLKGWMTHEELIQLLDTAHLFLLTSVVPRKGSLEAIPNAIKEAMLVGLPVIVTYHGGTMELVRDGINGFLVPERDAQAIRMKLEYLIEHPEVWPEITRRASEKVRKMFDVKQLVTNLEDTFYKLLKNKSV